MELELSRDVIAQLLAGAAAAHPLEVCGILLGVGRQIDQAIPTANVHVRPETHFEIDPQALIDAHRNARQGGLEVIGYYHSHPNGLAQPSQTDRLQAARDGSIWAIVAGGEVTFWRDGEEGFAELPYRIVGR